MRDLFTTATERPSQRRDLKASAIWNHEFLNANKIYIFSHDVRPTRQAPTEWRLKCPELTQDGMLNMSSGYKPGLIFTAVGL